MQFIKDHKDRIQLVKTDDYPRRKPSRPLSSASKLGVRLSLYKRGWTPTLEEAREVAKALAQESGMPITDADIESAVILFVFEQTVRAGDLASAKLLAQQVFELAREDAKYISVNRDWVQLLISAEELTRADETALSDLQYIAEFDQSTRRAKNYALFWTPVLQKNRQVMPRSVAFFTGNFPAIDLDKPIPVRQFFVGRTAPGTGPTRG